MRGNNMSEKITAKILKKQKEKAEKLMSIFGQDYNEWLYQQTEKYIEENSEKAFNELFRMKETFSSKQEKEVTLQPEKESNQPSKQEDLSQLNSNANTIKL
jgi:hypothetical protein